MLQCVRRFRAARIALLALNLEADVEYGTNDEFITLARVVKTQGRHGEVAAEIHSDVPDRFTAGMKLFALAEAERAPVRTGGRRSLAAQGIAGFEVRAA